jgi:hypothetical protein
MRPNHLLKIVLTTAAFISVSGHSGKAGFCFGLMALPALPLGMKTVQKESPGYWYLQSSVAQRIGVCCSAFLGTNRYKGITK